MTEAAHNLIDAFKALPVAERHAVFLQLATIAETSAGEISDEELIFAGEQLFLLYDAEEAKDAQANKG